MPSYRLIVSVGNLKLGTQPESVLSSAATDLGRHVNVEAFDVRISRGVPQLVLRFTAPDKSVALDAALRSIPLFEQRTEIRKTQVLQRVHGRWESIG